MSDENSTTKTPLSVIKFLELVSDLMTIYIKHNMTFNSSAFQLYAAICISTALMMVI